jgi:hypothetical protein
VPRVVVVVGGGGCSGGVGEGVARAVAPEVFGGGGLVVGGVVVACPAAGEDAGEFVLEGASLRGLVVWLSGGFFENARALELVAVEELVALRLGLLEGAGEFCGRDGRFGGVVVVAAAAGWAEGFGAFEVEFKGVLGELVHEAAVAHVFDCGCSSELLGRLLRDVVVGF